MNLGLLRLRFILAIIALSLCLSANAIPSQQRIYISGEKGYDTYRIPALLMTGRQWRYLVGTTGDLGRCREHLR